MSELPVPDQEQIISQNLATKVAGLTGLVGENIISARRRTAESGKSPILSVQELHNIAFRGDLSGCLIGLEMFPDIPIDEKAGLLAFACRGFGDKKRQDLKTREYMETRDREDDESWVGEMDCYYQDFMAIREEYQRKNRS
jgi:hypothetical protein